MSENKIFSVIIPTRHRNDQLCACLERLKPGQQSLPFESYEVIVSDDGEDSSAAQAVQMNYPWALWVPGPRRGPAANRNNGARFAGGQWLVFTDDDCLPDSFWLSSFQAAMQATAVEAMEGAIYPIGDPDRDLAHCPSNLQGGYFWSANIAVARGLFQKLGGFDERYRFADHEDEDLRMRASVHTDIVFVPEARVGHPVRVSSLPEALSSIPKRTQSWVCHIFKHQHTLVMPIKDRM